MSLLYLIILNGSHFKNVKKINKNRIWNTFLARTMKSKATLTTILCGCEGGNCIMTETCVMIQLYNTVYRG